MTDSTNHCQAYTSTGCSLLSPSRLQIVTTPVASLSPQPKADLFHKYHPFQFVCPTLRSYWWVLFDHRHGLTSLSTFLQPSHHRKKTHLAPKSRLTELFCRLAFQDIRWYKSNKFKYSKVVWNTFGICGYIDLTYFDFITCHASEFIAAYVVNITAFPLSP